MEMMRLKPSFARKPNPDGFSSIHLALQNEEINMVHRLLQVNQDVVRVKGKKGITPLHYAAETDNLDLLATFLSVCPDAIEDVTNQNETALHIALKYDKLDAFKLLVGWLGQNRTKNARIWERTILNWKDEEGNTVLHVAVSKNQHQVVRLLLAWRYNIDINVKNSDGKTTWDILQEQRQVNNKEISVMLRRGRALPASSVPTVTSYANYLRRPKFIFLEKLRINYIRERTRRLDDNRNALLVVAILLITMTYQGVLSPPGGLWQDDYNKTATSSPAGTAVGFTTNLSSSPTSQPFDNTPVELTIGHQSSPAGTAVGFTTPLFWIFLVLNSVTFMLSSTIIFLLVPFEYIYVMFQATLVFLIVCYFSSLMIIGASLKTIIVLVSVSALLFIVVVLKGFS